MLIDPEGNYVGHATGEGNFDVLDRDHQPAHQGTARQEDAQRRSRSSSSSPASATGDSPLFFPGKVLADAAGKRLFIADSTHHRIVITDLDGKKIAIAGTGDAGQDGRRLRQGPVQRPAGHGAQGRHALRRRPQEPPDPCLDLKKKTVKTVAGTGEQERATATRGGPALKIGPEQPLGPARCDGNRLFIAMAGHHQIWRMDLARPARRPPTPATAARTSATAR